jgi:hypothetical protein
MASPLPRLFQVLALMVCSACSSSAVITWNTTAAEHREETGSQFTYECPSGGLIVAIWGTDTYSDDSSICTAAVHAGLIDLEQGGEVTIKMRPGLTDYASSRRHDVTSGELGPWDNAFTFIR